MSSEKFFLLRCHDEPSRPLKMSEKAMKQSQLLRTAMEFGNDEDEVIPVQVDLEIMRKVIAFCEHYADEPPRDADDQPIGSSAQSSQAAAAPAETPKPTAISTEINEWDRVFLGNSCPTIMALADAADYLGAFGLLHVCCKKLAQELHGKTDAEMREILNVTLDVSKSEYDRWLLENSWLEERK